MAGQQPETGSPDLASVWSFLKDRQLKETEQALRRELGMEGVSQTGVLTPHLPPVSQSDTEPVKYKESYSRPALTSTSTATDLQSARHDDNDSEMREPLQLEQSNESDDEYLSEDEEEDISDPFPSLCEEQRSVSWPGSLPNHLIKFSGTTKIPFNTDKAHIRATPSTAPTAVSCNAPTPSSLRHNPQIPLWAVGSSAFKPLSVTSSPSSANLTLAMSSAAPVSSPSPSVIYSMLPAQSMGLRPQPLLAPLLTIMPSAALMTTSGLTKSTQPLIIGSPTKTPSTLPTLVAHACNPISISTGTSIPLRRESSSSSIASSPRITSGAEPSTGQSMLSPVGEQMKALNQVPAQRTLASIPPSEMTPQYVELKAFAEEFKTKRIRLGYTQGSVGESLARKGYSNFAQSTISRFEQMQLSATNAAAIKQVLEKWLQETEFPESVTQSSSDVPMLASRKRKKRAVFMPQTKSTLDEFFRQNPRPNRQAIESMAQQLDLLPEEVRVWFCNKRQKQKQSSTSSTSSYTSAASPTSSGLVSLGSPSLSPKRRSPSPKTNFTIEELSKSSTNSSSTTSPVLHTSPFSISPTALSLSATGGVFMPVTTLPHMTVTQTRA